MSTAPVGKKLAKPPPAYDWRNDLWAVHQRQSDAMPRRWQASAGSGRVHHAEHVLTLGHSNSPGSKYETDAVPGDWRSDLSAAPADVVVDIWRRGSKADTGYRDAAGKWFAFEGGTRAWELAPGAVLQWKPKT